MPLFASHCWVNIGNHGSWFMELSAYHTAGELQTFSLTQNGSPSPFSPPQQLHISSIDPWRPTGGEKHTETNKRTKSKMAKLGNTQSKHRTRDSLALHLPDAECFSSMVLSLMFRKIVFLGLHFPLFWVHINDNRMWLLNKYLLTIYFQFSWSNAYWILICAGCCALHWVF